MKYPFTIPRDMTNLKQLGLKKTLFDFFKFFMNSFLVGTARSRTGVKLVKNCAIKPYVSALCVCVNKVVDSLLGVCKSS